MAIAWIPYGAYWSTPFARWQGAFAGLHSLKFAAWTARGALARRGIDPGGFDLGVLGTTVPQRGAFYGMPWVAGELGAPGLAGPTIAQACATGARCLEVAARGVAAGAGAALVLTADRVSNGPHIYYPAPGAAGGTGESEDWVLANFARDPWAGVAMVETAENVARAGGFSREEQDALTLTRYEQYRAAVASGFHARFMDLPFAVPDARFAREAGAALAGDEGVHDAAPDKVRALKPVLEGGTVTYAGQTHPADGNAGCVVTTRERARAMAPDGPEVAILGFGMARVDKAMMPSAPAPAAAAALAQAGVGMDAIDAVTTHNPFAVNDLHLARASGFAWERMNAHGCSLVWGHPQAPTGVRAVIELIETLTMRGGGRGLFTGCAAGDSAMALVVEVSG